MKRRLVLVVGLGLTAALTLSGCLVISSVTSGQLNTIGNVRIVLQACFSQNAGSCTDLGNSGFAAGGGSHQAMVAFRIPSASTPPETFGPPQASR